MSNKISRKKSWEVEFRWVLDAKPIGDVPSINNVNLKDHTSCMETRFESFTEAETAAYDWVNRSVDNRAVIRMLDLDNEPICYVFPYRVYLTTLLYTVFINGNSFVPDNMRYKKCNTRKF